MYTHLKYYPVFFKITSINNNVMTKSRYNGLKMTNLAESRPDIGSTYMCNGSNSKLITVVCDDAQTRDYVSVLVV